MSSPKPVDTSKTVPATTTQSGVDRYPLRITLVALIVGLMVVGMFIAGATATALLRASLQAQAAEQLRLGPPGSLGFPGSRGGPIDPNYAPYASYLQQQIDNTVSNLVIFQIAVGGVVTVLAAIAGYLLVRRSLRPLNEVEHAAGLIAQGDLSQRVPDLPPSTEVGSLAQSLNVMLGQVEESFEAQRASEQQARESEERMRQFVADASHELRTPLTSILGYAELNRGRGSNAAAKPGGDADAPNAEAPNTDVARIEDEAIRMREIVENLLLLAKLDQAQPQDFSTIDLLAAATSAIHTIEAVAPSRDIALLVNTDVAPIVMGDESALRRVLLNLLQNAANYTPESTPIEVDLGVDDDKHIASIIVRDYGPGVDEADLPRIFERFYRGDKSRSRATGGMGLGLSIVQSIVEAHGGNVAAERGEPGMIFTVNLPLA